MNLVHKLLFITDVNNNENDFGNYCPSGQGRSIQLGTSFNKYGLTLGAFATSE